MKTRSSVFVICVCILAVTAAIVVIRMQKAEDARLAKLDRFCLATKMAVHDDRHDLLSGSADDQEAAAKRFWSKEVYHGADSLAYCIEESRIPQMPLACPMTEDKSARWKCLGDFAAKVEQALP